jgi:hypothetical protein
MNRMLHARLAELERASEALRWASQPAPWRDGSASDELREALRAQGFKQRETEGLARTFARFLGITTQELKRYLSERVYGHAPEREITP